MFSAPSGIFMGTCLFVDARDRETWLEAGETGQLPSDPKELGTPHAVIWNADRRIFFGNPSFEVASEADLQDVPGYMDMLFTKHGFKFAPPNQKKRVRQLFMYTTDPKVVLTPYNRLDSLQQL